MMNLIELGLAFAMNPDQFEDKQLVLENQDKLTSNSRLSFEPNDIKYLIVARDDEILRLMDRIAAIKRPKYSDDDVRKLYSRIMSSEQVLNDF